MKLNKFVFILLNLCPLVLGCGEEHSFLSEITKKDEKPYDKTAYEAFLKFAGAQKDENSLHLFFFDVGHGNFILVRDKYNAIIVDAGAEKKTVVEGYIRELFLACLGEAHLSQIIITHDHKDHKNYVEEVKKWGKNEEIQEIKSFENQTPLSVISNVTLSFLQPLNKITTENENDKSSVFVLTYQGINVLFTGDATGLSLDNYVEKHQERNNAIVVANRALLKDIHLFVMPHHGSSTEDSFRWTLYVTKNSSNLLASVICGDPFESKYNDVRNWVRDISWPDSMRNRNINNFIYYWSARSEVHKKQTNAALFITGAEPCRCVYFKIQGGKLYKYDNTKQDFVHLNGHNTGLPLEDSYEAGKKVMPKEDETTTGEMQMRNIPMKDGGFGINPLKRNSPKMEEDGPTTQKSSSSSPSFSPIKEMEVSLNPKIEGHPLFSTKDQSKSQGNQHIFMEIAEQNEMQEVNPSDNWNAHDQEEKMQTRNSFSLQTKEDSSVINDPTQQSSLSGPNSKKKKQQAKKPNRNEDSKENQTKHISTKSIHYQKHGYGTPSKMQEVNPSGKKMSEDDSDSQESDEDSSIDTEERMSEDDNGMRAISPSNVYKFQDAFDDTEKDYVAYAS